MKGDADLITLAVGLIPIVVMIVFSSQFIVKNDSVQEISATVDYSEKDYQQQVAAAVMMQDEMFHNSTARYHFRDSQDKDTSEQLKRIKKQADEHLSRQSENFYVDIDPEDGQREVKTSGPIESKLHDFTVTAASRKTSQLEVEVFVGDQK